jgi:Flp pilus assembly protein TadG
MSMHSQKPRRAFRRLIVLGSELWADRRGGPAILTALGATVLMGFAGLGVDVAYWELTGRKMQSAADAAALAASVAVSAGASATQIANAADAVTAGYGFANGRNGVNVTVTTNVNNTSDVQVKVSQQEPRYFTRLFLASAPTVSATAVAKPPGNTGSGMMCLMALDETAGDSGTISLTGSLNACLGGTVSDGTCTAPTCDLYNDSPNATSTTFTGGASLSADHIMLSGGYSLANNASIWPDPPATYVAPTPDPYSQLSITASSNTITVSDPYFSISRSYSACSGGNKIDVNAGNQVTISPGVYCEIDVEAGGQLTLNAGTYIIDRGNLKVKSGTGNYGSLSGTGVTIILTSSHCTGTAEFSCSDIGTVQLGAQVTTNLMAPTASATSGIPGIAIWVDKRAAQANNPLNGGASQNINGVIYLPSQNVNYSGGSDTLVNNIPQTACTQVLAYTASISGNTYLSHAYCAQLNIPVRDPASAPLLAE